MGAKREAANCAVRPPPTGGLDGVRSRPDVAPQNKTVVNHAPSGALTICLLEITPAAAAADKCSAFHSVHPGRRDWG